MPLSFAVEALWVRARRRAFFFFRGDAFHRREVFLKLSSHRGSISHSPGGILPRSLEAGRTTEARRSLRRRRNGDRRAPSSWRFHACSTWKPSIQNQYFRSFEFLFNSENFVSRSAAAMLILILRYLFENSMKSNIQVCLISSVS